MGASSSPSCRSSSMFVNFVDFRRLVQTLYSRSEMAIVTVYKGVSLYSFILFETSPINLKLISFLNENTFI